MHRLIRTTLPLSFWFLTSCLAVNLACPRPAYSQQQEDELYFVAQKAFDDGFYDVAVRYIQQLLEQYPSTEKRIPASLLLGQCYFFKGQYLKAYETFHPLLTYSDFKDATLFWLGETYLKGSDYKQAELQYQQLIKLFPDSIYTPQAYYSLGWIQFENLEYTAAIATFQELVKKYSDPQLEEDAYFKIAEAYYHLEEYDKAIEHFQKFVVQFPQSTRHAESYFYVAEAQYNQEQYLQALSYYAKTSEISYDNKLILMSKVSLGWSYLKLKKHSLAEERFTDALAFAKEKNLMTDDVLLGQATLYTEIKEYEKALAAYSELIKEYPSSPRIIEAYLGQANTYYLLERFPMAITSYQYLLDSGVSLSEEDLEEKVYFGLAWAHLKNGEVDKAIGIFQTIKNKTSSPVVKISALTQIGDAYQDIGRFEKAIDLYDQILKEYPDSPYTDYVQYRQGVALLKSDNIKAATLSFQTLKSNFPESRYLHDIEYYLAVAHFKKEEWTLAKQHIELFIKDSEPVNEFLAEANYIYALCEYHLGNYAKAIRQFDTILHNFPEQSALVKNAELYTAKSIYKQGDSKEGLKRLKILVYKYPDSEVGQQAMIWLGDHFLEQGDLDKAIAYYEQFIKDYPGSDRLAGVYFQLGETFMAKNMLDDAVRSFKHIREDKNKELFAKAQLEIADIFSKDIDAATAIKSYEDIIIRSPEFKRDAYVKIAEIYKSENAFDKAVDSYQQALQAKSASNRNSDVEIQFMIGDTYELMHQADKAVEAYLKIVYLYTSDVPWIIKAYLRVARIWEDKEDWHQARVTYNKILQYQTEEAVFARERLDWIEQNKGVKAQ